MLFDLAVWVAIVLLTLPILVFAVAWLSTPHFYRRYCVSLLQRVFYHAALTSASICAVSYVWFWIRHLSAYATPVPSRADLILEQFMYVSILCSLIELLCLAVGRGPH
jgi:hypothetical protein